MVAIATEWVKGHSVVSLGGLQQAGAGIEGAGVGGCKALFLLSHSAQNGVGRKP